MRTSKSQVDRIRKELIKVGVTGYGLGKLESKYLPSIIHEDEHINGVVYGKYSNGLAMLVATDKRVLFLDRKPFFTILDELTYEVVSGVTHDTQGLFAGVILHTRIGDYALRYVNKNCAEIFVHFIEKIRLERGALLSYNANQQQKLDYQGDQTKITLSNKAIEFLKSNDIAVLSTVHRNGNIRGSTIYYYFDPDNTIYILTKSETNKVHNILSNKSVALTIYDEAKLSTLSIQGNAEIMSDQDKKNFIFNKMLKNRQYQDQNRLPPVADLSQGSYMILQIIPTNFDFQNYQIPRQK